MATAKRRGVFAKTNPRATRDLEWFMDWKINRYIDYLDSIDSDSIYKLEYDTDVPTKEELLNGIDQNHVQNYNIHTRKIIDWEDEEKVKHLHIDDLMEYSPEQKEALKKFRHKRVEEEHQAYLKRKATLDERKQIKKEEQGLEQEKNKYKMIDRMYVNKYYKEFGMEGLDILYENAVDSIKKLKDIMAQSDVITEKDSELLDAYKYRQEYVTKLINKKNKKYGE
jgi:hypothetical protein